MSGSSRKSTEAPQLDLSTAAHARRKLGFSRAGRGFFASILDCNPATLNAIPAIRAEETVVFWVLAYELHRRSSPQLNVEVRERNVKYYLPRSGAPSPFGVWRDGITDQTARAAIAARIARLRGGNFGDSRPIGGGASESAIHFGPGFRVYYGIHGDELILLFGGDKSTQASDIQTAKRL